MQKRITLAAAGALVLAATGVVSASAHGGQHGGQDRGQNTAQGSAQDTRQNAGHDRTHQHGGGQGGSTVTGAAPRAGVVTFVVRATGDQEVPTPGGPAVNDPDARADGFIQIRGDRITYALRWKGTVPSLGHIHQGAAGTNGPLKAMLFGSAMPDSVSRAAGHVTETNAPLAAAIRENPGGYYVNLHSAEYPGGAARGRLKPAKGNSDPLGILRSGPLTALSNGEQEVPKTDASKVGDPDGHALTTLDPRGTRVGYSLAWSRIQAPTLGHVHRGAFGTNGEVVLDFFDRPVPDGVFAVAGRLTGQNPATLQRIRANPGDYYSNLHNPEYADGAVRGQFVG
ncbi:CHRD domain-containing protein [Streptomyces yaizuensis]|uniref:CHRD domain-containing protein n=1 Tax=Streptomyces yaizuensis TaxID=2989713 RepID=A0ABQ5NT09_9ACTN|nr:CHRD domain-containing protein [Streptomyces sp. YSPA8]GLF93513.1 CHRD domain-containing protein [Streptomyces sp. YSPA8]